MGKVGSKLRSGQSTRVNVDENGISIDGNLLTDGVMNWPVTASGQQRFDDLEFRVVSGSFHSRSGAALGFTNANVLRFSDVADTGADRFFDIGDLIPDITREQDTDTKLGMRCESGETATVIINPGVAGD